MDVPIPFPLPNADACQAPDSGIKCPLKKGDATFRYKNTLLVLKSYPKVLQSLLSYIYCKYIIGQFYKSLNYRSVLL